MSEFQGSDGQWELVEVGTTIKRLVPDFDIDNPDASDFKDNAGKFMKAMRLAKTVIAKALGEQ